MKDGKVVDAELEVIGQTLILRTSYCDDSLRGKGILAEEGKYRVGSDRYPEVNNMILHLPGNEKDRDNWVCIYRFDSPHNAHRAKTAFEALIDKINAEHAEPESSEKGDWWVIVHEGKQENPTADDLVKFLHVPHGLPNSVLFTCEDSAKDAIGLFGFKAMVAVKLSDVKY